MKAVKSIVCVILLVCRRVAWSFSKYAQVHMNISIAFVLVLEFYQSGVFITESWFRTSKMLRIETIVKNYKIFWSLQVHTCV